MVFDKELVGRILGIVLTAVVALLAVFGYDVVVIQPRAGGPALSRAVGDTNFTNVVASDSVTAGNSVTAASLVVASRTISISNPLTVTGVISNVRMVYTAP